MKTTLTFLIFLLILISCNKEKEPLFDQTPVQIESCDNYDVFLIVGQSNTNTGLGLDRSIDTSCTRIDQLGRYDIDNFKVIRAFEPLQSHDIFTDRIGFSLSFANHYVKNNLLGQGRKVMLIHCGKGGTGFARHNWNPGDELYADAIKRINSVLTSGDNNILKAILWHQGENDVAMPNYQKKLDNMINQMRKDIVKNQTNTPFILGGMSPAWIWMDSTRRGYHQNLIANTVKRVPYCGFADSYKPFPLIPLPENLPDGIHFDAGNQRELGKRYFNEYLKCVDRIKKQIVFEN